MITMNDELECGTVGWFNKQKRYGSIVLKSGEEIFFHENDYQLLFADDGGKYNFYSPSSPEKLIIIRGITIYFQRGEDDFGRKKAVSWCFEYDYLSAVKTLTKRSRYRVLKQTRGGTIETLWEGTNLDNLMLRHPRTPDHDDLANSQNQTISFGLLTGESWTVCEDPRHVRGIYKKMDGLAS